MVNPFGWPEVLVVTLLILRMVSTPGYAAGSAPNLVEVERFVTAQMNAHPGGWCSPSVWRARQG
jgi:hypothetical protein